MFGLGLKEIIIIAIVLILLFGTKKIPELATGIADAVRTLRKSFSDDDKKVEKKEEKKEEKK
jgi:sec-independent protein translocase protein TatA